MLKILDIDLRAFDGEGAAGDAATGGNPADAQPEQSGSAPDAQVQENNANAQDTPAKPTFDELIKGEYKQDYDKRVQDAIGRRFKAQNAEMDAIRPIIAALQQRYNIADGDDLPKQILQAIEKDRGHIRQYAEDHGYTEEQAEQMMKVERDAKLYQDLVRRQQTEVNRQQELQRLQQQAEAVRAKYPTFDIPTEQQNPRFMEMLRRGVDMMTAYEVVHQDDIINQAVQDAERKFNDKVRAKQARPDENGAGAASAAAAIAVDVTKMSRKEFRALQQRVMNGERITLR